MLRRLTYISILGAIHALSFAPNPLPSWGLPWVQLFSLAILFVMLFRSKSTRESVGYALTFGVSNFVLGLYWLFISMHTYGGMAAPLAALGVVLLACYLSLYIGFAVWLARWLTGHKTADLVQTWPMQLLVSGIWASAWTLSEWLRGILFTGFPWLNLGYAHVDGVLAPWAPVIGVYGICWLASFASASVAMLACHKDRNSDARAAIGVATAIVIGLAGIGLGHAYWTKPSGAPMIVRLVQGNVPQSEKFDPQLIDQGINQYLTLANLQAKSDEGKPQLIVLPETVLPILSNYISAELWQRWLNVATQQDATILMGVPIQDSANTSANSAIAFNSQTTIEQLRSNSTGMRYDKHHLVPFGEFVPTGFKWFVDAMHIPLGEFKRGSLHQKPFPINGQKIAPNICYEDLFGEEIINQAPEANILINMSNLAWFGDTWALRQHLQISRMRAIETGRPMLRSTNSGMTAAIDPKGMVRAVLATASPGVIDVEVQGTEGLTPYVRWGNIPAITWSFIILLMGLLFLRRRD